LKLEGVVIDENEQTIPKKKVNNEDISNYAKLSMEGGHKGRFPTLLFQNTGSSQWAESPKKQSE